MNMTSKERLLACLRGEPTDRVPVSTYELVGWKSDSWENNEPSYARLMEIIRRDTDCIYMWDSGGVVLEPSICRTESRVEKDGTLITRKRWEAGGRSLTCTSLLKPGIHTVWRTERLLKTEEDIYFFLELPLRVIPPDRNELYRRLQELGDHGIMMHTVEDALCVTAELFSFRDFLFFCATRRDLIERLLLKTAQAVSRYVDLLLEADFGPLFRIVGPEYATPPYLDPATFEAFVLPYDKPVCSRIKKAGKFVRLHCHGKIARVLQAILALEPDGLDPLEPPPDGDITLKEAKQRTEGRVTLFGNLELKYLEHGTPRQVEALTRQALSEGMPGGRFVIMPTAAPINVPLSRRTEENFICFIETALRYGRYS